MDREFWASKKVLLTGHTGFKGSWLSLWLQSLGAEVCGYALPPPTSPSLFEAASVVDGMASVTGDVCDGEHLKRTIAQHRSEIVIHMAAQSLVRYSYSNPVETYATNVMGTVNVLEAVRHSPGVRVVVVVTTDKCYENREWVWGYRENEPMGGHDPYSSSKGCAELVTSAYRRSFFPVEDYERHGVAVASARAGNVIGGGDWAADRLIPDIVNSFSDKRPVIIRSPRSIRPWQFVLEPLNGYLCLAERLWQDGAQHAGAWNFGPGDEDAKPVSWIVERLANMWGEEAEWKIDTNRHPHEATYLKLDCSKAKSQLRWRPKIALPTALEWIVEWARGYGRKENMRDLTERQIARYEKLEADA